MYLNLSNNILSLSKPTNTLLDQKLTLTEEEISSKGLSEVFLMTGIQSCITLAPPSEEKYVEGKRELRKTDSGSTISSASGTYCEAIIRSDMSSRPRVTLARLDTNLSMRLFPVDFLIASALKLNDTETTPHDFEEIITQISKRQAEKLYDMCYPGSSVPYSRMWSTLKESGVTENPFEKTLEGFLAGVIGYALTFLDPTHKAKKISTPGVFHKHLRDETLKKVAESLDGIATVGNFVLCTKIPNDGTRQRVLTEGLRCMVDTDDDSNRDALWLLEFCKDCLAIDDQKDYSLSQSEFTLDFKRLLKDLIQKCKDFFDTGEIGLSQVLSLVERFSQQVSLNQSYPQLQSLVEESVSKLSMLNEAEDYLTRKRYYSLAEHITGNLPRDIRDKATEIISGLNDRPESVNRLRGMLSEVVVCSYLGTERKSEYDKENIYDLFQPVGTYSTRLYACNGTPDAVINRSNITQKKDLSTYSSQFEKDVPVGKTFEIHNVTQLTDFKLGHLSEINKKNSEEKRTAVYIVEIGLRQTPSASKQKTEYDISKYTGLNSLENDNKINLVSIVLNSNAMASINNPYSPMVNDCVHLFYEIESIRLQSMKFGDSINRGYRGETTGSRHRRGIVFSNSTVNNEAVQKAAERLKKIEITINDKTRQVFPSRIIQYAQNWVLNPQVPTISRMTENQCTDYILKTVTDGALDVHSDSDKITNYLNTTNLVNKFTKTLTEVENPRTEFLDCLTKEVQQIYSVNNQKRPAFRREEWMFTNTDEEVAFKGDGFGHILSGGNAPLIARLNNTLSGLTSIKETGDQVVCSHSWSKCLDALCKRPVSEGEDMSRQHKTFHRGVKGRDTKGEQEFKSAKMMIKNIMELLCNASVKHFKRSPNGQVHLRKWCPLNLTKLAKWVGCSGKDVDKLGKFKGHVKDEKDQLKSLMSIINAKISTLGGYHEVSEDGEFYVLNKRFEAIKVKQLSEHNWLVNACHFIRFAIIKRDTMSTCNAQDCPMLSSTDSSVINKILYRDIKPYKYGKHRRLDDVSLGSFDSNWFETSLNSSTSWAKAALDEMMGDLRLQLNQHSENVVKDYCDATLDITEQLLRSTGSINSYLLLYKIAKSMSTVSANYKGMMTKCMILDDNCCVYLKVTSEEYKTCEMILVDRLNNEHSRVIRFNSAMMVPFFKTPYMMLSMVSMMINKLGAPKSVLAQLKSTNANLQPILHDYRQEIAALNERLVNLFNSRDLDDNSRDEQFDFIKDCIEKANNPKRSLVDRLAFHFEFIMNVSLPSVMSNNKHMNSCIQMIRFPYSSVFYEMMDVEGMAKKIPVRLRSSENKIWMLWVCYLSCYSQSDKSGFVDNLKKDIHPDHAYNKFVNPVDLTFSKNMTDVMASIYTVNYYIRGLMDPRKAEMDVNAAYCKRPLLHQRMMYNSFDRWTCCRDKDENWDSENRLIWSKVCNECYSGVVESVKLSQIPFVYFDNPDQQAEFTKLIIESKLEQSETVSSGCPYFQQVCSRNVELHTPDITIKSMFDDSYVKGTPRNQNIKSTALLQAFTKKLQFDKYKRQLANNESYKRLGGNSATDLASSKEVPIKKKWLAEFDKENKMRKGEEKRRTPGIISSSVVTEIIKDIHSKIYESSGCDEGVELSVESQKPFEREINRAQVIKETKRKKGGIKKLLKKTSSSPETLSWGCLKMIKSQCFHEIKEKVQQVSSEYFANDSKGQGVIMEKLIIYLQTKKSNLDDYSIARIGDSCAMFSKMCERLSNSLQTDKPDGLSETVAEVINSIDEVTRHINKIKATDDPGGTLMYRANELSRSVKANWEKLMSDKESLSYLINKAVIRDLKFPISILFSLHSRVSDAIQGFNDLYNDKAGKIDDEEFLGLMLLNYGEDFPTVVGNIGDETVERIQQGKAMIISPSLLLSQIRSGHDNLCAMNFITDDVEKLKNMRYSKTGYRFNDVSQIKTVRSERVSIAMSRDIGITGNPSLWGAVCEYFNQLVNWIIKTAPKAQFGSDRDLVLQSLMTKEGMALVEIIMSQALSFTDNDILTHPELKSDLIEKCSNLIKDNLTNNGSLMILSNDETKWGPCQLTLSYLNSIAPLHRGTGVDNILKIAYLNGSTKEVMASDESGKTIMKAILNSDIDIHQVKRTDDQCNEDGIGTELKFTNIDDKNVSWSEICKKIIPEINEDGKIIFENSRLKGRHYMTLFSHMSQGIYHKTSTMARYIAVRSSEITTEFLTKKMGLIDFTSKTFISSDDSITISQSPLPGKGKMMVTLHKIDIMVQMLFNIFRSPKSLGSSNVPLMAELYSTFTTTSPVSPYTKLLSALITTAENPSLFDDSVGLINQCKSAVDSGSSLCESAYHLFIARAMRMSLGGPGLRKLMSSESMPMNFGGMMKIDYCNLLDDPVSFDCRLIRDLLQSGYKKLTKNKQLNFEEALACGMQGKEDSDVVNLLRGETNRMKTKEKSPFPDPCIKIVSGEQRKILKMKQQSALENLKVEKGSDVFVNEAKSIRESISSITTLEISQRRAIQSVLSQEVNTQNSLNPTKALKSYVSSKRGKFLKSPTLITSLGKTPDSVSFDKTELTDEKTKKNVPRTSVNDLRDVNNDLITSNKKEILKNINSVLSIVTKCLVDYKMVQRDLKAMSESATIGETMPSCDIRLKTVHTAPSRDPPIKFEEMVCLALDEKEFGFLGKVIDYDRLYFSLNAYKDIAPLGITLLVIAHWMSYKGVHEANKSDVLRFFTKNTDIRSFRLSGVILCDFLDLQEIEQIFKSHETLTRDNIVVMLRKISKLLESTRSKRNCIYMKVNNTDPCGIPEALVKYNTHPNKEVTLNCQLSAVQETNMLTEENEIRDYITVSNLLNEDTKSMMCKRILSKIAVMEKNPNSRWNQEAKRLISLISQEPVRASNSLFQISFKKGDKKDLLYVSLINKDPCAMLTKYDKTTRKFEIDYQGQSDKINQYFEILYTTTSIKLSQLGLLSSKNGTQKELFDRIQSKEHRVINNRVRPMNDQFLIQISRENSVFKVNECTPYSDFRSIKSVFTGFIQGSTTPDCIDVFRKVELVNGRLQVVEVGEFSSIKTRNAGSTMEQRATFSSLRSATIRASLYGSTTINTDDFKRILCEAADTNPKMMKEDTTYGTIDDLGSLFKWVNVLEDTTILNDSRKIFSKNSRFSLQSHVQSLFKCINGQRNRTLNEQDIRAWLALQNVDLGVINKINMNHFVRLNITAYTNILGGGIANMTTFNVSANHDTISISTNLRDTHYLDAVIAQELDLLVCVIVKSGSDFDISSILQHDFDGILRVFKVFQNIGTENSSKVLDRLRQQQITDSKGNSKKAKLRMRKRLDSINIYKGELSNSAITPVHKLQLCFALCARNLKIPVEFLPSEMVIKNKNDICFATTMLSQIVLGTDLNTSISNTQCMMYLCLTRPSPPKEFQRNLHEEVARASEVTSAQLLKNYTEDSSDDDDSDNQSDSPVVSEAEDDQNLAFNQFEVSSDSDKEHWE